MRSCISEFFWSLRCSPVWDYGWVYIGELWGRRWYSDLSVDDFWCGYESRSSWLQIFNSNFIILHFYFWCLSINICSNVKQPINKFFICCRRSVLSQNHGCIMGFYNFWQIFWNFGVGGVVPPLIPIYLFFYICCYCEAYQWLIIWWGIKRGLSWIIWCVGGYNELRKLSQYVKDNFL